MGTNHRWDREQSGCRENPGVWGLGGSAVSVSEECRRCGMKRSKVVGDVGRPTRNHGWQYIDSNGEPL